MNISPLVSICCITYNHVNYIRDAIEGFLIQKTSFPFEIIIHDDASTDGTVEIIEEYANKYPDLFVKILQKENQWSKGGGSIFARFVFPIARGKYIALCEGDDYWTDSLKLQKQVDIMEENPDCSLCVGGYELFNTATKIKKTVITTLKNKKEEINENGYYFNLEMTKKKYITKTLTALFKNEVKILNELVKYKNSRDIHLFYHLLKNGQKGYYFKEILGAYRIHVGGIHSMLNSELKWRNQYRLSKELFQINNDEFSRYMHLHHTIGLLSYNIFNKQIINNCRENINLFKEVKSLFRSYKEIKLLIVLIGKNIKTIL